MHATSTAHITLTAADGRRVAVVIDAAAPRPEVRCYRVIALAGGRHATRHQPCALDAADRRRIIDQMGDAVARALDALTPA